MPYYPPSYYTPTILPTPHPHPPATEPHNKSTIITHRHITTECTHVTPEWTKKATDRDKDQGGYEVVEIVQQQWFG